MLFLLRNVVFLHFLVCASSNFLQNTTKSDREKKKKQQFYNLGGPGYMCAAKKVQRTISRLFEYEKNRII